jgi:hypothetical protein
MEEQYNAIRKYSHWQTSDTELKAMLDIWENLPQSMRDGVETLLDFAYSSGYREAEDDHNEDL